jgi:radical SAM protein with 4Fe4S-binding SPASM domain
LAYIYTADGKIWECHLFADFYKGKEDSEEYAKFYFGAANYENLRMDQFYTSHSRCADCPELEECQVCPMGNG